MIAVSASIVLYKSGNEIRRPIIDFLCCNVSKKLYLVDNSPTNELQIQLADLIANPQVEYIFNNANIGFGAAHNVAIHKSIDEASYHIVLNPDVSFGKGVVESLFNFAEKHKETGLVTPKVIYPDGSLQYTCKLLPTPADLIVRRFLPAGLTKRRMDHFEMRRSGYNKTMEVPYIHGCFMFLRTEALKKVGLFDERFFMYPEDIDLTRRIHQHYKTIYYPEVEIVHEHARGSYKSLRLLWIHIVNMIKYFNKWGWFFDNERDKINKKILRQFL